MNNEYSTDHWTPFLISPGDIMSNEEVLDWLRKNRFRQPELSLFMYGLIAIAVGFVLYTGEIHEFGNQMKFVILIEKSLLPHTSQPSCFNVSNRRRLLQKSWRKAKENKNLINRLTHSHTNSNLKQLYYITYFIGEETQSLSQDENRYLSMTQLNDSNKNNEENGKIHISHTHKRDTETQARIICSFFYFHIH